MLELYENRKNKYHNFFQRETWCNSEQIILQNRLFALQKYTLDFFSHCLYGSFLVFIPIIKSVGVEDDVLFLWCHAHWWSENSLPINTVHPVSVLSSMSANNVLGSPTC